jgi:hypothetical protein
MFVPVFFVQLHPYFLAYVEAYLRTHFIMPFIIIIITIRLLLDLASNVRVTMSRKFGGIGKEVVVF